jgi:hypothetical protein
MIKVVFILQHYPLQVFTLQNIHQTLDTWVSYYTLCSASAVTAAGSVSGWSGSATFTSTIAPFGIRHVNWRSTSVRLRAPGFTPHSSGASAWRGLARRRRQPTPAEYRRSSTHTIGVSMGQNIQGLGGGGVYSAVLWACTYVSTYVGKYIVDSTLLHATDEMMLICSSFEWVRITICYWVKQKEMVVGNA